MNADSPHDPAPARSFGSVADAYDRARPSYPVEAVRWMVGRTPSSVVELGAGTGKLTDRLVELGHDVLATDPLDEMLSFVRLRHPDLRTLTAPAEAVPVATRSVDTVIAAQCFHWFETEAALREAARMLKPEGRIALVWNDRDERVPWVRKLGKIIGDSASWSDPSEVLVSSKLFGFVEESSFRHWAPMRKAGLRDLVLSRSNIAVMQPGAQERVLRKVDDLFDSYESGPDGLLLPYIAKCFRAVVRPRGHIEEPEHSADLTAAAKAVREGLSGDADPGDGPATTLIDFR